VVKSVVAAMVRETPKTPTCGLRGAPAQGCGGHCRHPAREAHSSCVYGAPACRVVAAAVAATSFVMHGDHVHGRSSQSWTVSDFDQTGWIMR
jgi:hypothetical protein